MKQLTQIIIVLCFLTACQKETDWLNKKPDNALVVPTTLQDFKALLSHEGKLNLLDVSLNFVSGEPYYLRENHWQLIPLGTQRNSYTWSNDLNFYQGAEVADWNNSYHAIYYCNVVLDGLKKIQVNTSNQTTYNEVLGTALFFRSHALYKLLSLFAAPYDASTANQLPGIVLPQTADVNEQKYRASLAVCYKQVTDDLIKAADLLPQSLPYKSSPTRTAAKALLARIYVAMREYDKAFDYADQALTLNNQLLDYNTLTATAAFPIPLGNVEDIFHIRMNALGVMSASFIVTDSVLYRSYATNDLRRTIFFNASSGVPLFKGSYEGASAFYSGIATDELYLIRAETHARAGRTALAMTDLNSLLIKRWRTGTFIPLTANTATEALQKILVERQKELLFRGIRWTDLRRLNTETSTAITLTRTVGGQAYSLPPLDKRYTFLIPDSEIRLSGIAQNPR